MLYTVKLELFAENVVIYGIECTSKVSEHQTHKLSEIHSIVPVVSIQVSMLLRWPTGDMQHALSLAHTKSDCCTQNQKSPTNLLSMHKFKVDVHKFELLHTKWVLQHTNSDLLHTKFCCSTQNSVAAHKLRPAAYKVVVAACKERCCCCYACFHFPLTAVIYSVLPIV